MSERNDPYLVKVLQETEQGHSTRRPLLIELEKVLGLPVVSLYTSFQHPVMLEDEDADMLEGVVQQIDLKKGLALIISSPGGDGLAAERVINICRSYSGTKVFTAIVPGKAKSAATMVCFGAAKIIMGPNSELGPVDPQLRSEDGQLKRFSVYNVIRSYEDLFDKAVRTKGNLQPFLLQLQNFDEREIAEYRSYLSLSTDIAVKSLQSGMMRGKSKTQIRRKIGRFLTPERTKNHGRPIYPDEARACGLQITQPTLDLLGPIRELHVRTNNFVRRHASKCIESKDHSFVKSLN